MVGTGCDDGGGGDGGRAAGDFGGEFVKEEGLPNGKTDCADCG